jgi:hypothetical protein
MDHTELSHATEIADELHDYATDRRRLEADAQRAWYVWRLGEEDARDDAETTVELYNELGSKPTSRCAMATWQASICGGAWPLQEAELPDDDDDDIAFGDAAADLDRLADMIEMELHEQADAETVPADADAP